MCVTGLSFDSVLDLLDGLVGVVMRKIRDMVRNMTHKLCCVWGICRM